MTSSSGETPKPPVALGETTNPPRGTFQPRLRAALTELRAYEPTRGAFDVRLDANEPPALLSASSLESLSRAMIPPSMSRYPDPRAIELREAIAARAGAKPEEVLVGVGSDEVIALLLTALDRPRDKAPAPSVVCPSPTFVMYRLSAQARGFKVVEVPLDAAWDLEVRSMSRAVEFARPNLVFLATPNNPTAASLSLDRLEAFLTANPEPLVVIDEAYVDYAAQKQGHLRERYPNVALLGTLSKIGFAALRVGWMIGDARLVAEIDKVRQPYNLPVPSQRGATFVLRELMTEVLENVASVVHERGRLAARLADLGLGVARSDANFLWAEAPVPADELTSALAARGVLIKSFGARGGRLARRVRITVGLPEENDRLLLELERCARH